MATIEIDNHMVSISLILSLTKIFSRDGILTQQFFGLGMLITMVGSLVGGTFPRLRTLLMNGVKFWKGSRELSLDIDIPTAGKENHIPWGKGYLRKRKHILRIHGKTCYRGLRVYTHRIKGGGREY